jgi:predicted RNase H-like HicB family nuclease
MVRRFSAVVTREGDAYVAQCLDVDVVSDGTSPDEALEHLREALELYFEDSPAVVPEVRQLDVDVPAARVG